MPRIKEQVEKAKKLRRKTEKGVKAFLGDDKSESEQRTLEAEVKPSQPQQPPQRKQKTINRNQPWYLDVIFWILIIGGFIQVGNRAVAYYTRNAPPPPAIVYAIQGAIGLTAQGLLPGLKRLSDPDIKSGVNKLDEKNENDDD
ncbi:MAG: hypothetical protein BRC41_19160 [Cyanobacteria bacterium QH_9_48_43]|nr:MAG: hypothetical protein BRC41_19160 [Cyanobacteria bacterium QH_9_48_43]